MGALLTAEDLARLLRVSLRTIRTLTSRRSIPFLRIGKSIRFRPADVQRALKSLTVHEIS
jgi:excisionase family DNA binding protein